MGATGATIFSDDEARDIRDMFRDLVAAGKTNKQIEQSLMRSFGVHESPNKCADFDEWGRFWLFLAATKHKFGRLDAKTRRLALRYIDARGDSEMYLTPALRSNRLKRLKAFARVLKGPQPKPVEIRPQKPIVTNWKPGDIFSYRLKSGAFALVRVIGLCVQGKDSAAIVEVLNWRKKNTPRKVPKRIARLHTLHLKSELEHARSMSFRNCSLHFKTRDAFEQYKSHVLLNLRKNDGKLFLPSESRREFQPARWTYVGRVAGATRADSIGACLFGSWSDFDAVLKSHFDLK